MSTMTLNVEASARDCWPSSPGLDDQHPSSLAKPMDMETESPSGSRANSNSAISVTESPSAPAPAPAPTPTPAWAVSGPDTQPQTQTEPEPEPDFYFSHVHVDLNTWYPRYLACVRFFLSHSQHTPAVQALASFLNIRLPGSPVDATCVSARRYIRRLIVTGADTPWNLRLFFGDDWAAGVGCICTQERLNYLFAAKSGGWVATKSAYDILPDEQAPFLRPLREPTEEELRVADSAWSEWLAMEDWMVGPRRPW